MTIYPLGGVSYGIEPVRSNYTPRLRQKVNLFASNYSIGNYVDKTIDDTPPITGFDFTAMEKLNQARQQELILSLLEAESKYWTKYAEENKQYSDTSFIKSFAENLLKIKQAILSWQK